MNRAARAPETCEMEGASARLGRLQFSVRGAVDGSLTEGSVRELTLEEGRALVDRLARQHLGMSGEAFMYLKDRQSITPDNAERGCKLPAGC